LKVLGYNQVFLGNSPAKAPALYSLMTWVDFGLGVKFPRGGIYRFVESLHSIAQQEGVQFIFNSEIIGVQTQQNVVKALQTSNGVIHADAFLATTDYSWFESLLPRNKRCYSERYWKQKSLAPTAFWAYVGLDTHLPDSVHHNLFLSDSWDSHFDSIFSHRVWPQNPSFYFAAPCKTDPSLCPDGKDSLFLLVPVAPGLEDSEEQREKLFRDTLNRLEEILAIPLQQHIAFHKIVAHREFRAMGLREGTTFGLAHTLFQSAFFRPRRKSKKLTK